MKENNKHGLEHALQYPLLNAIFNRRTRRVSKGVKSIPAGSLSYTSNQEPQTLSSLEEAILIAVTGTTGMTMPDRPFETESGKHLVGSPNITMAGRAAASPDNAQATHFFLINDSGTYFLKRLNPPDGKLEFTPENLIARAEQAKQRITKERINVPREFPYYLDSNRYMSNLPGTTILFPIVDTTVQYINALLYVMSQGDGYRPTILDDRNFYREAGVKKWVKNGFLNKDINLPLGIFGTARTHIEAHLLLQNIMLTTQALGLGGWIHATIGPPFLLGHPYFAEKYGKGLGFRYHVPGFNLFHWLRWGIPLPKARANPVGLDGVIEGMCPPYYENMSDAVDALIERKYGKGGTYSNPASFKKIFKAGLVDKYLKEVPHHTEDTIQCVKDICNYIYKTHGRFPAHVDAMYVPGIWLQAHHLDLEYYDRLFDHGYADSQRRHQELWHSKELIREKAELGGA